MDVIHRIDVLMNERGWTDYRLASEAGLSGSTIANFRRRNTLPSIPTLEAICKAFGISLSQFFSDDLTTVQLNMEQKAFFDKWVSLSEQQKKLFYELIDEMR